jgi:hypothetical protein
MEESNGELTVTVKAKNMPELRKKLLAILGEAEPDASALEDSFPDEIKRIFPDYEDHPHAAAMLAVLIAKHKGRANAVDSSTLAQEMVDAFPRVFKGKTVEKVSSGNVFSGTALKNRKLAQIDLKVSENSAYEYRVYWA